ncbi:MAG: hypothetical protein IJ097_00230 [Bacilli bacterium]|nr:hypothetical protein [Bacilli bacterium]
MKTIIRKFFNDFKEITRYYNFLVNKTKNHEYVENTNEWLIDNYYLLVEHKNNILNSKVYLKNNYKLIKKNYYFLKNIVNNKDYNIDFKYLVEELKKYQKETNTTFTYKELSIIFPTLVFIYTDSLNKLYKEEYKKLINKDKVRDIINNKRIKLNDFLDKEFNALKNPNYIFEINSNLNKIGEGSNELFKELNEFLEKRNISLKDLINEEYQRKIDNTLLVSNIFTKLKDLSKYSLEELYEKVSKSEKILLMDPIYKNMTTDSKQLYRHRLVKEAKKHHKNEYNYLEKIYDSKEHIGFKLYNKKNNTFKVLTYILLILLISLIFTMFLTNYFIKYKILGFIIILIPISQLIIQIVNEISNNITPTNVIPKLDYSKGIPEESKTMIVIPTIISNTKKIKEIFDNLETFYIINKSDNLYFTLLGDPKSEDNEIMNYDNKLCEYGKEYADKLNKKYKKDLFYFVYRKRVWNECENKFLGYGRKYGALLQFNKILLGEKVNEKKYFNANTLKDTNLDIKYIITLDTNTKLVLNSILNLIGTMAHPLNKPILNKDKIKVIKGYAIMQPRISVDIETTNRSLYSQIFAGIKSFDIAPNVYQDLFEEGSFEGKGIYDLKVFNKVLSDTIPENLVLSYDLLASNYLRCGYVSDIELIDEFPSKFLTNAIRQYRLARKNTQIIGWLRNKIKNKNNKKVKNPINILGKYKILNNIIKMFLNPMLLLILILSFTNSLKKSIFWLTFVVLEIVISIIFSRKEKHYKNIYFEFKSLLIQTFITFGTIPYYTKLYMDAFTRSLYRLLTSHKNLLNWITSKDADKQSNSNLKNYIYTSWFNILISVAFIFIAYFKKNYLALIPSFIFLITPILLYLISRDIDYKKTELDDKKIEEIKNLAYKTWEYFKDNLKKEYNYLIPYNYQENREEKLDIKTSPTAIGYSLTTIISACELEFIDKEEAIKQLKNILNSIDSLPKWHGHLYNWYDIKTKKVLKPNFISTVESTNLVASLIVVREFLNSNKEEKEVKLCDKLIKNTDFKKLYTKNDTFSIGYDEDEGCLSLHNYNNFASPSILTSYIAIALKEVNSKHWFSLDKSLPTYKKHKGLISCNTTSFEYCMPFLFIKNYPNTLLNEIYNFSVFCQKDYINKIDHKLPWGIYNDSENRIVISPYLSIMVMESFPEDVYENIKKIKELDMESIYGLYDQYDYDNKEVVKTYYAHHEGMILLGLTNYLKNDIIKDYFYSNNNIHAYEILLKEKVYNKSSIDMKIAKYKKYNYKKEVIENNIRFFDSISCLPEVSVLSNKKYCLLMNDRGNSFSRYRTLQLNRYRKVTNQEYGIFLFVRDTNTNYIWSNTYAPINIKPDKYEVVFAADKIKYLRRDDMISTKTEIVVCKDHNAEIRKITFKNESDVDKELELTSYTEPILSENMEDISHKVFNNMFIKTEYDKNNTSLIAKRKTRGDSNINSYMVTKLVIDEPIEEYSYETERSNFIGRCNTLATASLLTKKLSNYAGDNLDPVLSLRNKVLVKANSKTSIYLIVGFGRNREQINEIINYYNNTYNLEKTFEISTLMNTIYMKNMNITGQDMQTYNTMLNYLYQTTKLSITEERMDFLRRNALPQTGLWKFGISGDRPIITVEIKDISDMNFIKKILKAFEYYKFKSIYVDIIIINSEIGEYKETIKKQIDDELYRIYTLNSFYHTPGNVVVIDSKNITREDRNLLNVVPRLRFVIDNHISLKEAVDDLKRKNTVSDYPKYNKEENIKLDNKEKLSFNNSFGGFKNNGREYVIYNKETPVPWSNVIANKTFGTIITNNGCGYTYAYNSSEFKISSWTNEIVTNDKSEGFKFNNKIFDPEKCTHGFGYSILESETNNLNHEITEFVAKEDNVKIYLLKLKNKLKENNKVKIEYFINPTFGNFEEKTTRHILSEFIDQDNYLKLRNVYSSNYSDVNVFMSSSEKITSCEYKKMLIKNISFDIDLKANEEKELVFILGCSLSDEENIELIKKYTNINNCHKELNDVYNYWNNKLSTIEVDTPDDSFNYVINGWYLYQTISSRILAKAGFYQVSGAFSYRDQLQDAMNICLVDKEFTKKQILMNASHQFIEGDVLHWWHEKNHFGLRSRYKDDHLWLVYATIHYLNITEDYDILDEKIPYIIGDTLSDYEKEKGIIFNYSDKKDTLLKHCIKSLQLSMKSLGSHKIPLMGGGDWNEGMNRVGIKGKGESVWLGFFLCNIIDNFTKVIEKYDKNFNISEYIEFNTKLKENLNNKTWDGNHYLRAFFDNKDPLGSSENSECKIDLISQSFSILSEVAPKDRQEKVIASVENELVDNTNKIIKLLNPAFSKSLNNPGYIMNYPKGVKENGGQNNHAVSWYLMALIKKGLYDKAYSYYQMINPINRTLKEKDVLKYKVEPYVIAEDIYTNEEFIGRGGWTWYTGSASWFYRVGIEYILGITRNGNNLLINPKIPTSWDSFKAVYHYKDTEYKIEVKKGIKQKCTFDGKEIENNKIPLKNDKTKHKIIITIYK